MTEDFLSTALRDRLVCGLRSESIQRKLLTEVDLTFDKAERIDVAMELAQRNAVDLQPSSGGVGVNKELTKSIISIKGKQRQVP